MDANLESIPTNRLIDLAKRTALERAIIRSAFFWALIMLVGSWFSIFRFHNPKIVPGLCLCFVATIIVPLTVFSTTKFLGEFRGRHFLRELDRRFGRWNVSAYVRYFEKRQVPGTITCIFQGRGLPGGWQYHGCIVLKNNGDSEMNSAMGHGLHLGPNPWCDTEPSHDRIAPEQLAQLMLLIEKSKGTGKIYFNTMVRDGFPATAAVLFGDGSQTTIISSNLCGLTEDLRQDDRIKLLELVASLVCKDRSFNAEKAS